ncbi:TIGR03016 family PEP-CTERM system-associated outer membrane protein [Propionivibrio sp.]|uniref:TIGR03016 family PEP-CTERM system-associated outer membrane protein n=1 Tax=Propionivibrio sp. TaxID=2212460 RepID=UPI003BEF96EC
MAMVTRRYTRIDRQRLILLGLTMGCATFPVFAVNWTITPTLAFSATATDNLNLSSTNQESSLIFNINPGINIAASGGDRFKLRLAYGMNNLGYTNDPSRNNNIQNNLNASATLEAVENWLFIDANANIYQQAISPFGAAPLSSSVNTNVNSNITETSNYQISPYIRGSFGSFADYQLRYSLSSTGSQAGNAYESTTQTWLGSMEGKTRLANLGWSAYVNSQSIDQGNLRTTEDNRVNVALTYQITPQFNVSLIGGREEQNFINRQKQSNSSNGYGFAWSPTERTKMEFRRVDRFFGPSNTFSFSHRTARTAWTMSASKEATSTQSQGSVGLGANNDLLVIIFSADPRCSSLPPAQKDACANNLALNAPGSQLQGGFQTNQAVVQQLRLISFALLGVRNTVTFSATQNNTQNLTAFNQVVPIGSGPSQNNVDQIGASVNWSHQLSPQSTLGATIARSNSKGTGLNNLETTQQGISLNFSTQLGAKTNAGLSARRVSSDGTTNYTENALTGTLFHQF